ncbi:TIGR01777 family protein [Solihabitans fulvus]|uniref:TIGR01777 family protein n=1 Tax=Solihabitans fulvus TaxID=1892852 RepID=A0A5B2XN05_9PSEU|nr:TIGR01777 family oxidoreductase [Solihabitans fulvus]KAA2264344.1 TIGR01777 family protein [Solihabitans fulvus]
MRVVVAGSSGLMGTSLVALLRGSGHEVLRLVRRRPAAPDERRWDPPAGRIEDGALDGVDAVVNLCGAGVGDKRWNEARKQVLRDSRTVPTEVLASAAAEHGVATLVNASAVGYYGDTGDRVTDETAGPGTGFLADLVREWELSTAPAEDGGVRVALLRTGLVLSPSGGLMGRLRPLFSMLLGGQLGNGRQYQPWISIDDAVAAIRFVLEHDEVAGPVNITGPGPVTNAEFTRALGRALGRPTPWVIPGFALRLVLGEFADEAVLVGQRAVPRVLERHGFTFAHSSLNAALNATLSR